MKTLLFSWLMSSATCGAVFCTPAAYAQEIAAQEVADFSATASSRFQLWATEVNARTVKRLGKPEANQIEPDLLGARDVLLERLRQEKWTTDTAILKIVQAWMELEAPRPNNQGGKRDAQGLLFPNTIGLIDQLAPILQDRPLVLARLYDMKGGFFAFDRKRVEAAEAHGKAVAAITPLAREAEIARLGNLLEQASLISQTDEEKADALYREVLSMPWLYFSDADIKQKVKIIQLRAGRNLIGLHKGDVKALQGLTFLSSRLSALRETLNAALKEAGAGPQFTQE